MKAGSEGSTMQRPLRERKLMAKMPEIIKNRLQRLPLRLNRAWYNYRYGSLGEDFIDEKWDNLIILDAARADIFRELDVFGGIEIGERYSPASSSLEFMQSQFVGRELHDTVYVTANPHENDIPDDIFHRVIDLIESDWDIETQTVLPEVVEKAALEAYNDHPDKRLIVHFMQPHFPFLGPAGEEIPAGIPGDGTNHDEYRHPWFDQMWGEKTDRERLIEAYRENHELVAPHARRLVEELPGRSVVTADHANLIGERGIVPVRLYGHPRNFAHPNLRRVPWLEFDGEAREVTAEPPLKQESIDDEVVQNRLKAFGYA